MDVAIILLLLLLGSLQPSTVTPQCPMLEARNIANEDSPSTNGLLPASFLQTTGQQTLPSALLHSYTILCLSVGLNRGTFRSASIVANFTCIGHMNCTGEPQFTQFEVECLALNDVPMWSSNLSFIGNREHTLDLKPDGSLESEVRTDCAFCISPLIIPQADNIHHCVCK